MNGITLSMSQFASFEDYSKAVEVAMLGKAKPVITYEGTPHIFDFYGGSDTPVALVDNIEGHPNSWLNNQQVRTSKIVNYDAATGRIETLNSIYVPR